MRVAYFTYWGSIGPRILEWLATSTNDEIVAVISRPGEPGELIKDTAYKHYLPLYQPLKNVNDPRFMDVLRSLEVDCFISMYFGRLELYAPIIRAFPKVQFVLGHMGLLTPRPAIDLAERFSNVWLETSFQSARTVADAIERIGPDRILLGSDWPCSHGHGMMRVARALIRSQPSLEKPLFHANAERLIGPLD